MGLCVLKKSYSLEWPIAIMKSCWSCQCIRAGRSPGAAERQCSKQIQVLVNLFVEWGSTTTFLPSCMCIRRVSSKTINVYGCAVFLLHSLPTTVLPTTSFFHIGFGCCNFAFRIEKEKRKGVCVYSSKCSIFVKGNNLMSQNLEQKYSMIR